MKWIGNRISYQDHNNYFTLIISGKTEDWKFNLMLVWAFAWLFCGVSVIYMLFYSEELKDQQLYYTTFLVFWAYFFYKISKSIIWRKFGIEYIKIDDDFLTIKKSLWSYGKAKKFMIGNITSFKQIDLNQKSFAKVFNDSFWVVGQPTLNVNVDNEIINFGAQVSDIEGKKLIKILNKRLNNFKSIGKLK